MLFILKVAIFLYGNRLRIILRNDKTLKYNHVLTEHTFCMVTVEWEAWICWPISPLNMLKNPFQQKYLMILFIHAAITAYFSSIMSGFAV